MVPERRESDAELAAFQAERRRRVLRDIDALFVLIESLSPDLVSDGVWPDDVRDAVHRALAPSGIPIINFDEAYRANAPWLYVNLHALRMDGLDAYAISVEVSLRDTVWLDRDELRLLGPITAATWIEQTLVWTPLPALAGSVRDAVAGLVGRFVADHAAAQDPGS